MPITTGLPSTVRRPLVAHSFLYSSGARSLVPIDRRVVVVGIKTSAGTLAAATPTEIYDTVQSDTLGGVGSEVALMARAAFAQMERDDRACHLFMVTIAEPGAGTARVVTLTAAGTATEAGTLLYRIAGRLLMVGVAVGDAAATVAAALKAQIDAAGPILPLTAGVVGAVVTCTLRYKGANGNDVAFREERGIAGITIAYAQSAAGAGDTDLTASLDTLTQKFDGIATANHIANDVTDLRAHLDVMNTQTAKKWRRAHMACPGSIATATALAAAFNDVAAHVYGCEGAESLPGELAAAQAVMLHAATRPNPNLNGRTIVGYPPIDSVAFLDSEIEAALAAGVTPLVPLTTGAGSQVDGQIKLVKLTTTKTLDGAVPVEWPRLPAVSAVGWAIAEQLDAKFVERFGPAANPDGALVDSTILGRVRDLVVDVLYTAEAAGWIRNVDDVLGSIAVEIDGTVATRVNIALEYVPVVPLDQAAFVHRVSQSVTVNR